MNNDDDAFVRGFVSASESINNLLRVVANKQSIAHIFANRSPEGDKQLFPETPYCKGIYAGFASAFGK